MCHFTYVLLEKNSLEKGKIKPIKKHTQLIWKQNFYWGGTLNTSECPAIQIKMDNEKNSVSLTITKSAGRRQILFKAMESLGCQKILRVGNSLFALLLKIAHFKEQPWAIRSCCSLQKSGHEHLLTLLFTKRQSERIPLVALKKRELIHSWFEQIASKKRAICSKKSYFWTVLSFPPFYAQKWISPVALCSFTLF